MSIKKGLVIPLISLILLLVFSTLTFAQGQRYKSDQAWSFGILADTQ